MTAKKEVQCIMTVKKEVQCIGCNGKGETKDRYTSMLVFAERYKRCYMCNGRGTVPPEAHDALMEAFKGLREVSDGDSDG